MGSERVPEVDGGTRRGATTWRDGVVSCGRVAKGESTHIDNQHTKGLHVTRDLTRRGSGHY